MKLKFTHHCSLVLAFLLAGSTAFAQHALPIDIALQHLRTNHQDWGLTEQDIENPIVSDFYTDRQNGISHVYFQQQHQGIPVYNALLNVNITADGKVFFVGKRFVPNLAAKVNTTLPIVTAQQAVQNLAAHLGLPGETARLAETTSPAEFVFEKGNIATENIKVKLSFQPVGNTVRLVWDVTLYPVNSSDMWSTRMDAVNGTVVNEHNWTVYCDIGPNTYAHEHNCADHVDFQPVAPPTVVTGETYNIWPIPYESPNHGPRTLVTEPQSPVASPFGWHDTDGVAGAEYTITRGNNVHAFEDSGNLDASVDNEPEGGTDLVFDYPWDADWEPAQFQEAATVNLFYMNNIMHDFAYHYGFDEASGNFQVNNFGNGGNGNDYVLAQAQDGGGTDNADFASPPDGGNGRMQMYLWGVSATKYLNVNAPASIAGQYETALAAGGWGAGAQVDDIPETAEVVIVEDGVEEPYASDGCEPILNGSELAGKIALIDRGGCEFGFKALAAQNEEAIAVIICNFEDDIFNMGGGAVGPQVTIPVAMISASDCQTIRQFVGNGLNVTISLPANPGPSQLDGDLDNGIIAHEFGHGISFRLTGGPNNSGCLFGNEQMGEGWSDFMTLVTTVKPGDTGDMKRGIGTYAFSDPTNGRGFRPFPYSTDMSIDPHTYGDLPSVAVPHGVGSIWCIMLWDMYWAFVDEYGWDENLYTGTGGNNKAIQLVFDGMKIQPCGPGFVDGRDAILAADVALNGGANKCLIWNAFARRGLGLYADQGTVADIGDETPDFEVPCECRDKITVNKSVTDFINAGDKITVNITLNNCKGDLTDATEVEITDELPEGVSYMAGSASVPATVSGNTLTLEVGSVAFGETTTITYTLNTDPEKYSTRYFLDDVPNEDADLNWLPNFIGDQALNLFAIVDAFGGNTDIFGWFCENLATVSRQELVLNPDEVTFDINLARPTLRFYHRYNTEPAADGGVVDVRQVGTTTWKQVQDNMLRNGYPAGIQYGTFVVPNLRAFSGNSGPEFLGTYVDLSEFSGQEVQMRFRFGTDDNTAPADNFRGWLIDDVEYMDLLAYNGQACVTTAEGENICVIAPEEGTIVESQFPTSTVEKLQDVEVAIFPNPAGDVLSVQLASDRQQELSISLLTVDGKEVLARQTSVFGNQHVSLNVSQVPAGLYFVRVSSSEGILTSKVIIE